MKSTQIILSIILVAVLILVIVPLALKWSGVDIFSVSETTNTSGTGAINGVLIRSEDRGNQWNDVSVSEDPRAPFPSTIFTFVPDPRNQNNFFIGTKASGLWKSINGARTWNRVNDSAGVLAATADVYDVEVAGSSSDIMYVAAFQGNHGRVLKSENSGMSFHEIYSTTAEQTPVFDISVDPSDSGHILIATGENGLFESKNGGATWAVKKWFTKPVVKILVNPRNRSELYVMTADGGIFKSISGGAQWTGISENAGDNEVSVNGSSPFGNFFGSNTTVTQNMLLLDPNDPSHLYLGSQQGFSTSEDGGVSFKKLNLLLPKEALPISAIGIDPHNSNVIFVAAKNELDKSTDKGATWSVRRFSTARSIINLIIPANIPDSMFIILGK